MGKKQQTAQATADAESILSWREKRFVIEYLDNGGNGTRAYLKAWRNKVSYDTARNKAAQLVAKSCIQAAIANETQRRQDAVNYQRDEALRFYVAVARARISDYTDVLAHPKDPASYSHLDDYELAIKNVTSSPKNGNKLELYDKMAAVNELWDKLGLGQGRSGASWTDKLDAVLGVIKGIEERRKA